MSNAIWQRLCAVRHNIGENDLYANVNATRQHAKFLNEIYKSETNLNQGIILPDEVTEADRQSIHEYVSLLRKTKTLNGKLADFKVIEVKAGEVPPKYTRGVDGYNSHEPKNKNMAHFVWYLTDEGEKVLKRLQRAAHHLYVVDHKTLELSTDVMVRIINSMLDADKVQYDVIEFLLQRDFDGVAELRRRVVYDKLSRTVDPQGYIWKRS